MSFQRLYRDLVRYPGLVGGSYVSRDELNFLRRHIRTGGVFMEIGTFCGTTIAKLASLHPDTTFISIDCYEGDVAKFSFPKARENQRRINSGNGNLALIVGRSAILEKLFPPRSIDVLFVDGDHSYGGCLADIKIAATLLKPRGWLLAHDIDKPGVKAAVDELVGISRFRIIARENRTVSLRRMV